MVDFETTVLEYNSRIACPWVNDIVAYSLKSHKEHLTYYINDPCDVEDLVAKISRYDMLIAHNAKFECLYLWEYETFQDWLRQGGKIYCTQLAEYYISNYQYKMPALRDTAVQNYGCKDRIKWIDRLLFEKEKVLNKIKCGRGKNWRLCTSKADQEEYDRIESYKCVSDLPKDKVLEDVRNDVLDTETIYLKQIEELDKRGPIFKQLVINQMDCLLSTTEMEYNGMKIDKKQLAKDKLILEQELMQIDKELTILVEKYWRI